MANKLKPPAWASIATIALGAIPATAVAVMPLMAFVLGVAMLFAIDSLADLVVVLGLTALGGFGVFGTVSLWWIGLFGRTGRWVTIGLVCGLLAIAPYSLSAFRGDGVDRILDVRFDWDWLSDLGFLTAPLVAMAWCLSLALRTDDAAEPASRRQVSR